MCQGHAETPKDQFHQDKNQRENIGYYHSREPISN